MRTCSEDPHLCGASWLLRLTSLLLSVCSAVTQSPGARGSVVDDSGNPVPLKGTLGASVLFHMIKNPELLPGAKLESITWGVINQKVYTPVLQVSPGGDGPQWLNFQDQYEKRVHVVDITTLRIDNLTLEDSGLYRVQESYTRGRQYDQDFHLTVYEPVPCPQIQAMDLSLTPGGCNLTLECDLPRTRQNLTVSWESECLPRELEQRPAPGPAPNPWTLAVNLPLSRPSPSLTCVVSNQVDQKNVTLDLGDVCGHDPQGQTSAAHLPSILVSVVVVLLILGAGAGLSLWKRRGVKKHVEPGTEAGSQEEPRDPDGGIHYAELSQQGSRGHRDKILLSGISSATSQAQAESAGRRPAMGACSEDPHLCGASWLLRLTSLLLSVCSAVTQSPGARGSAVDDSGNPVPLKGTLGASVLFHMIKNPELPPEAKPESITWGVINQKMYTPVLQVIPRGDVPRWLNCQDKFEKRVHVLNKTTLRMDNLTLEDSGLYRAQESYSRGRQYDQDFHLTVYEAVPRPQIWATVLSLTPGWCNITMECNTTETRKSLTVTWENESLPRELEQRPAPGPAPNPWTLAVNLPLSRPSPSLTCVVSNQADQRTATLDLGDVCGRDQCCPLAWYLGICCGRAADPRSWAVPLEETWGEEARGAWDRVGENHI
ncbi:uncharacterized protein LOC116576174 isoform X2 [Mustela erminea]|uniref:uncharacterized protein LOC116576174 isoform X2 n=1 Tax=Mustela erminea TaxID=36723 RepID=UPI0013869D70|nr:uncharacterized protein LOC116576174 isoform X2 [Mustela erminea]